MICSSHCRHRHVPQRGLVAIIAILLLGSTAFAHEQHGFGAGWTEAELRIGHNYTLTMHLVRQLAVIGRDLNELAAQHPETCHWMNQITGPETLARQVLAFNDHTRVRQVIEAHLSVPHYLLTLFALNETSTFVHATEHGSAESSAASAENIGFYRVHRVEIETLLDEPDPC